MTTTADSFPADKPAISARLTLLLATACGAIAANVYYAQPLVEPISRALGMTPKAAGLIVTLTQIGYGLGLLLVVPLADRVENRTLILASMGLATVSLLAAAVAPSAMLFLLAAFFIGVGSIAVQILVPYASHLAPPASRGRVIGNVMSGLTLGIMLARPIASFVTELLSWHEVFMLSAGVMIVLALVLARALPPRRPQTRPGYGELLRSMLGLMVTEPVLRRRALYQAALFGVFSLFWTTAPLLLLGPAFRLTHNGVALFALAGVAGAVAAPIAGRIADRGWSGTGTVLAMLATSGALLATLLAQHSSTLALAILVAAAILIDFAVTANLVFGQRAIFLLSAELRSRINGLYMATFFMGGAVGSAVGVWAYASAGWPGVVWIGTALPLLALAYFMTGRRQ